MPRLTVLGPVLALAPIAGCSFYEDPPTASRLAGWHAQCRDAGFAESTSQMNYCVSLLIQSGKVPSQDEVRAATANAPEYPYATPPGSVQKPTG